jgi:NADP-dependent 3-hydroxy acid dehydrogenase YdfG
MPDLAGAASVVTGGGGGIGRATSLALAAAGARVVVADLQAQLAEETVAQVRAAGGEAIASQGDVARWDDMQRLRDETLAAFGGVDIVVANAGIDDIAHFLEGEVTHWRRLVETNVLGLAYTIKAFLPTMKEQRSGHLVLMASQSGRVVYAGEPIYIASKWAVVGLGGALRKETAALGVRVTLIEPGLVDTPMTRASEAGRRELAAIRPLTADDVAGAVLFALTQPGHVNVHELLIQPFEQEL